MRSLIVVVAVALLLTACAGGDSANDEAGQNSETPGAPSPTEVPTPLPAPTPTPTPAPLAINHIQVIGTHNSYHLLPEPALFDALTTLIPELADTREYAHRSLTEQLDAFGIRQLELDVYADPDGGLYSNPAANVLVGLPPLEDPAMAEPGFKVLHSQDYDYSTTCLTLVLCLEEVAAWSDANPNHLPVVIMIEYKSASVPGEAAAQGVELPLELAWTEPLAPTGELLAELDAEIRSVFASDQIIEPDDVRAGAATLNDAVTADGWPALADSRGQMMFALIGGNGVGDVYAADAPNLGGRVMFTNNSPGEPNAAFMTIDDPSDPLVDTAAEAGYLVRTRTDVPTLDARSNDTTRRDQALGGGAHLLSTDYYEPSEFFDSPYAVELPGGAVARCNPVTAPETCNADQLAE